MSEKKSSHKHARKSEAALECEGWPRGCLHVYTGDGKGKTTAAIGLVVRAAGRGLRSFVGQFMKGYPYGETAALRAFGDLVELAQFGSSECIPLRDPPKIEDVNRAKEGLDRLINVLTASTHRIVVADEVSVAHRFGLLSDEDLQNLVASRPADIELICTGRWAPDFLVERADYVTRFEAVKHPYDSCHLAARDGIER